MSATITQVPGHAPVSQQADLRGSSSPTPPVTAQELALQVLAEQVRRGRGGPVLAGALAGVLAGAAAAGAILGGHVSGGDGGLGRRIDKLEEQQRWNSWALSTIAKTQGIDLPPPPDPP